MCSLVHGGLPRRAPLAFTMHGFIIALLAAASYAQNNITEGRPSEIVWSEERLGEFARGNRFGGRRHETVGSLAADRGARAYLGLRPQARCKAFVRLGATSDGGRQACVRGVDQAAADALQCAWRFDSRWCKGFPAKVAPEEVRRAADELRRLLVRGGGDDCLVYSFGVRADWDFDEAAAALGCEVHSFDPTVTPERVPDGITFHRIGLGARDGDAIKLAEAADAAAVRIAALETIRCELGHGDRPLTILKIDIEGQEWEVLRALSGGDAPPAAQVLAELHYWGAACLERERRWFADGSFCSPAVNRHRSCTTWRRVCLGSPPSPDELGAMAATLRGLGDGHLAVARVEPNAYSNVLLNVSIATVADLDVLCCYESAIVATRPPRGATCR